MVFNFSIFYFRLIQIIEAFARQQDDKNETATEIQDENADDSTVESDDESEEDDISAELCEDEIDGPDSKEIEGKEFEF